MPGTLSWLDRIVPISRSVSEAARSHYERKELQTLFELQPRATHKMMGALPCAPISRAKLVKREALSKFFGKLNDSENPAETFASMRAQWGKIVRRKLLDFSLQDYPTSVDSPPRMTTIERDDLRVRFQIVEEFAEAMLYLATGFTHEVQNLLSSTILQLKPSTAEERSSTNLRQETSFCQTWRPEDDGLNVYTRVQNVRSVWPHLIEQVHPCTTKNKNSSSTLFAGG